MNELVEYMPDVCNKRDVDKLKKYQSEGAFFLFKKETLNYVHAKRRSRRRNFEMFEKI